MQLKTITAIYLLAIRTIASFFPPETAAISRSEAEGNS